MRYGLQGRQHCWSWVEGSHGAEPLGTLWGLGDFSTPHPLACGLRDKGPVQRLPPPPGARASILGLSNPLHPGG